MKLIRKVLLFVLSVTMIVAFMPAAFAGESGADQKAQAESECTLQQSGEPYEIYIEGSMCQSEAVQFLEGLNEQRKGSGLTPLKWSNGLEITLKERAAEIAMYYSKTRLDGTEGPENFRTTYVSVEELYPLLEKPWFQEKINDPNLMGFCAGTYENDDGIKFIAMQFSEIASGGEEPLYEDDFYQYTLMAKDEYLNCKSEFLARNYYDANPKNLQIGGTYHYWIRNYNAQNKDREVLFNPLYVKSSKTAVVTIDNQGTVKAKRAGVAKLTIKPSSKSGKSFTKTVVVRPAKTKSVKATSPKKGAIKVTWAKQTGVSGYQIYRSTKKSSGFKCIKTITSGSTKAYLDTKVKKGSTYYYKVRAYVKYSGSKYPGKTSTVVKCRCKR